MTEGHWGGEDDAAVVYEGLPDWHPALFVDVFRTALQVDDPAAHRILVEGFVTPESLEYWGDFSRARSIATSGLKISTASLFAKGAPDVAYVRLVETDSWFSDSIADVPATLEATLVWRPEIAVVPIAAWRIHHLGEPVDPAEVPRTAPGFDPRHDA